MNYSTTIGIRNRKEGFEPEAAASFKMPTINEVYLKVFAIGTAIICGAGVLFLQSL